MIASVAGVVAEKQPWEMTRGDYMRWYEQEWEASGVHGVKADTTWAWKNHEFEVGDALANGKRVPPEVLADYPKGAVALMEGS